MRLPDAFVGGHESFDRFPFSMPRRTILPVVGHRIDHVWHDVVPWGLERTKLFGGPPTSSEAAATADANLPDGRPGDQPLSRSLDRCYDKSIVTISLLTRLGVVPTMARCLAAAAWKQSLPRWVARFGACGTRRAGRRSVWPSRPIWIEAMSLGLRWVRGILP
jgi:hypothetical protein